MYIIFFFKIIQQIPSLLSHIFEIWIEIVLNKSVKHN